MLYLNEGKISYAGNISLNNSLKHITVRKEISFVILPDSKNIVNTCIFAKEKNTELSNNNYIISMKNVSVAYNGIKIISNINWDVKKGDRIIIQPLEGLIHGEVEGTEESRSIYGKDS
jgi:ABC-type molybdenum transport system ATPase subunit/photorepair protein PhrA